MNKNFLILIIIIIVVSIICLMLKYDNNETSSNTEIKNNIESENILSNNSITHKNTKQKGAKDMSMIYIKVNNQILDVELEDNLATKELKEKLKNGNIIVNAYEYGGFEKVGDLGFSLPREDKYVTTSAGDIVLYQGNELSIFYNSNSWNYTKLGKIKNMETEELRNILTSGDVTLELSLN